MLGEIFLANFLTKIFTLFLILLFGVFPAILATFAYYRSWGVKKFFKRFLFSVFGIVLFLLITVGVLYYLGSKVELKDPVADIINNQEKYKNLPCFNWEFNGEKYCFDRSKSFVTKKYSSKKGEDETTVMYFIPKALSEFPQQDKNVNIYWYVDKYHRDDLNEPERFVRGTIKDPSKKHKIYNELVLNARNQEFIEITKTMKSDWLYGGERYFIILSDKRVVMNINLSPPSHYQFYAQVTFQIPNSMTYFKFGLGSNQKTQKEFFQTIWNISQEYNQYLEHSKIK